MITRRMKWIVKKMRENNAYIYEHRDAFLEVSHYYLEWQTEERNYSSEVTKKMLKNLARAKLIKSIEHNPVYNKSGEFVTSETVYGLVTPPNNGMQPTPESGQTEQSKSTE